MVVSPSRFVGLRSRAGSQPFDPPGDLMPERERRRLVPPVARVARYDREDPQDWLAPAAH